MLNKEYIEYLTSECRRDVGELQAMADEYETLYKAFCERVETLNREVEKLDEYDPIEVNKFKQTFFYRRVKTVANAINRKSGFKRVVHEWLAYTHSKLHILSPDAREYPNDTVHKDKGVSVKKSVIDKFLREQRAFIYTRENRVANDIIVDAWDVKGKKIRTSYKNKKEAYEQIELMKRCNYVEIKICLRDHYSFTSREEEKFLSIWHCTDEELLNIKALHDL